MKVYIETYGCQMNVNDTEVVFSILAGHGYQRTEDIAQADLIMANTCSVRDNAEQRIWGRIDQFMIQKKAREGVLIGILGCMAERLKDAYGDISPVRIDKNGVSAFISIMRGCNNVCSYCVVPYTRGAERSRDPHTIVREACEVFAAGYKEVTLLGQNVDSYKYEDTDFAKLLSMVAGINPRLRVRFSTSNPQDISDDVIYTMARYPNICKHIHLPVQSGSDRILQKMRRRYTREWYLQRVAFIRSVIPDCGLTTDVIAGFCSETEEDHLQTLSLFEEVVFDAAFMFYYSERPGTIAARNYPDDVPLDVKTRRLNEIIALQGKMSLKSYSADVGRTFEVIVEGPSKKNPDELCGRASNNKMCVFPDTVHKAGDYVTVKVLSCTPATLICELV